jgi:hypothetical protein
VVCTAIDTSGNGATCTTTVTVVDTTPPVLTLRPQPVRLSSRHEGGVVHIRIADAVLSATDACDGAIDAQRAGVITRVELLGRRGDDDSDGCRRGAIAFQGKNAVDVRLDDVATCRVFFSVPDAHGNAAAASSDFVLGGDGDDDDDEDAVPRPLSCRCCAGSGCGSCPSPGRRHER